jgi:hypothetical protein
MWRMVVPKLVCKVSGAYRFGHFVRVEGCLGCDALQMQSSEQN